MGGVEQLYAVSLTITLYPSTSLFITIFCFSFSLAITVVPQLYFAVFYSHVYLMSTLKYPSYDVSLIVPFRHYHYFTCYHVNVNSDKL